MKYRWGYINPWNNLWRRNFHTLPLAGNSQLNQQDYVVAFFVHSTELKRVSSLESRWTQGSFVFLGTTQIKVSFYVKFVRWLHHNNLSSDFWELASLWLRGQMPIKLSQHLHYFTLRACKTSCHCAPRPLRPHSSFKVKHSFAIEDKIHSSITFSRTVWSK